MAEPGNRFNERVRMIHRKMQKRQAA